MCVCVQIYIHLLYIHTVVNLYACKPDVSTFVAGTPGIVNMSKQVKVHLVRRSGFKKGGVKVVILQLLGS